MVKVTSPIVKRGSGLRFSFGVKARTEMEIRCVKGMYRLKLVSCENNSGFKGLRPDSRKCHKILAVLYFWSYLQNCPSYSLLTFNVDSTIVSRKKVHLRKGATPYSWPNSCIGSKFTRTSAHPGASFE